MSHIFCTARDSAFEQLCSLFEELDTLHRHMRPDLFCKPEGTARDRALVAGLIAGPDSTILVAASAAGDEVFGLATLIIRRQPMLGVRRARLCRNRQSGGPSNRAATGHRSGPCAARFGLGQRAGLRRRGTGGVHIQYGCCQVLRCAGLCDDFAAHGANAYYITVTGALELAHGRQPHL